MVFQIALNIFADTPPPASLGIRVAEFERLNADADLLADDAIEDAARLAKHGLETQRLDEQTREYALAQAAEARAAGLLVVMDMCILKEHHRLLR